MEREKEKERERDRDGKTHTPSVAVISDILRKYNVTSLEVFRFNLNVFKVEAELNQHFWCVCVWSLFLVCVRVFGCCH